MRRMTGLAILLIGMWTPILLAAPPEAERLQTTLRGIRGLSTEFVQIREVALTGETIEAHGLLAFLPPDRFRLAYMTPEPQELVIRGDSLWVILPFENQAQRYPFSLDSPGSEIFYLFGAQEKSLDSVYDIVQEPWGSYASALSLVPKAVEPGYPLEEIRLVVGKDGFPERLFVREVTGDTVVFRFSGMKPNPADIEALVELKLPEGIEVIDASPPDQSSGLPIDPDD